MSGEEWARPLGISCFSTMRSALASLSPHQRAFVRMTCLPLMFQELTMDMPKDVLLNLARGYPKVVTQITVHSAEGLEKKYANESKKCRLSGKANAAFSLIAYMIRKDGHR